MILLAGHSKGGVGKSTLAANLAAWLKGQGDDVLLVDTDRQASTHGWAAVRKGAEIEPSLPCVQASGNVHRELLDLSTRYTHVIVDAGGRDSQELRTAMLAADLLLLPTLPAAADLWALEDIAEVVERAKEINEGLRAVGVLNRCPTHPLVREVQEAREYLVDAGLEMATTVLRDRRAYRRAFAEGLGVFELKPRDPKAEAELLALFREVLNAN